MKGLQLAREFYDHCRPILMEAMPELMARAAFGLVGEGSECFGVDDDFSQDHDFGPGFCIWLPKAYLEENRERVENALSRLPQEFAGRPSRLLPHFRGGRVGPIAIEDFYLFFTGLAHAPENWREWLAMQESQLAAATNGEVFEDDAGDFSAWRQKLLDFYPRDVWLKKIAARVMIMAQAGQYNLPRMLRRGDGPSAMLAAARFAEAALSLVYLLNRRYMPFYKWAPKMCRDLPVLGQDMHTLLQSLAAHPLRGAEDLAVAEMVEDFCGSCAAHLCATGLSQNDDSWLWAHGPQIIAHVENESLRRMNLLQG